MFADLSGGGFRNKWGSETAAQDRKKEDNMKAKREEEPSNRIKQCREGG